MHFIKVSDLSADSQANLHTILPQINSVTSPPSRSADINVIPLMTCMKIIEKPY